MAKAKVKLFPYIQLDQNGKFLWSGVNTYSFKEDKALDEGYVSKESRNIVLYFPAIEIEVEYPDAYQEQALKVLRHDRERLQGEHHALMTRLQFAENSLLGLAAPDILDAGTGPSTAKDITDEVDDIPF